MELHIVSDGTGMSTYIVTPKGERIHPVRATISLEASCINEVELEFVGVSVDVKALLTSTVITCPMCSESMTHTCQHAP